MRNLTLGGIATAAVLLAAAPTMAQAGIHSPIGVSLSAGSRYGSFHHVTYRHRHTYAYRRYYRYRHTYAYRPYYPHRYDYGYGGYGGYGGVPTFPSWYGHSSYHF
jgi:hypothetical protein